MEQSLSIFIRYYIVGEKMQRSQEEEKGMRFKPTI
jgi:hypothetical protein